MTMNEALNAFCSFLLGQSLMQIHLVLLRETVSVMKCPAAVCVFFPLRLLEIAPFLESHCRTCLNNSNRVNFFPHLLLHITQDKLAFVSRAYATARILNPGTRQQMDTLHIHNEARPSLGREREEEKGERGTLCKQTKALKLVCSVRSLLQNLFDPDIKPARLFKHTPGQQF